MALKVSLEKAIELIDRQVKPLSAETLEATGASGRVLAERMSAWADLPHADISMLDGYALRAEETQGAGPENRVSLKIAGTSTPAAAFEERVPPRACVKVFAGAAIPEGLNAVAGDEAVEVSEETVSIAKALDPGAGIRKKGEDFQVGQTLAEPGALLHPALVGLCVAGGWSELKVIKMPRVRVLAVGDELTPLGGVLEPGKIYPSSAAAIMSWLREKRTSDLRLQLVLDDEFDLQEALPRAHEADFVITLGGTGKSERDIVIPALEEMEVSFLFRGLSVRPGHYTSLGMLGPMVILCLPGGPSAADMMWNLLGKRIFHAMMGLPGQGLPSHPAILQQDLPKPKGQEDRLVRVKLERAPEGLYAAFLQSPSLLQDIATAEGVIHVRAGQELKKGDKVRVWLFRRPPGP